MRNIVFFLLLLSLYAKAQDGALDPSFGTGGIISHSIPLGVTVEDERQRLVVLSDGSMLHGFTHNDAGEFDFAVARYTPDGQLDTDFNSDGIATVDFGGGIDFCTSIIVQPDGKIILSGYSITSGGQQVFAIARLNDDGTPDITFSGDGKQTTAIANGAISYAVRIHHGDRIVQVGYALTGSGTYDIALVRYESDGDLDNSFDTDGIVTTDISGNRDDAAYSAVIQQDGKIVVAGYHNDGSRWVFAFARYQVANGALDNSFSGDGKQTLAIGASGSNSEAYAITVQTDGKIVAAGYNANGASSNFVVVRLNTDGTPDNSFDGDGIVIQDISPAADDMAYSIGIQADQKILVAGRAHNGTDMDFVVARFTATGALDVSGDNPFNGGGAGRTFIHFGGEDHAYSIASQGNNIIVAGVTGTSLGIARLLNSSRIIPVKLVNFTALKQNQTVVLRWQTVNEQEIAGYEVERSADGSQFTKVGTVAATGHTSSDYSFTDAKPLNGVNFYRLKIINTDNSFSYSHIVAMRFQLESVMLQAFPNPVSSSLNVQFKLPSGMVRIDLVDVTGKTVKSASLKSNGSHMTTSIDMSSLQKGVYFIRVNEATLKIVKE